MGFRIYLAGGNRVTIRENDGELRFENEPTAADVQALELCAQLLFRQVFHYSKVPNQPVWLREELTSAEEKAA